MGILRRVGVSVVSLVVAAAGLGLSAAPASAASAVDPTSRFGSSINDTTDVARVSGLMGRPLSSVRAFFIGTPTQWSRSALLASIPDNGTAVIDFETGTPAAIQTFLSGHPSTLKCYASYWHEPEDNFTTIDQQAAYRASWDQYAPAIRAAGCIPTLILLKWSLNPASGRDWHNWYPAGDVDVLAFDAYNGGLGAVATSYQDPTNFLAPIVTAAQQVGLPWALAEVGAAIIGDPAGRAAWAHGVAAQVAKYPVPFAEWWEGPTGGSYNLDAATAAAWNADAAVLPAAPTGLSVTAGNGSAAVLWAAPADGGSAITGYTVTAVNTATAATVSTSTGGTTTSATLLPLTNSQTYSVSVTATNAVGTGPASQTQQVTPISPPTTVPDAPAIGAAAGGDSQASVTWAPPANDGGAPIGGYTVTAVDPATQAVAATVTAAAGATSATVGGLTNGAAYALQVAATNSVGVSAPSALSNIVTPATVAGAPVIGTATGGDSSAAVTWTAPAGHGGTTVTGYTVTAVDPASGAIAGSVTALATATSATVTGLVNGRSYALKVTATNRVGVSAPSALSNIVTPATVAGAPAIGTAAGGVSTDAVISATANWTAPQSNGGSAITGYQVEADRYSGTTLVSKTLSPTLLATARQFQCTGLVNGATYKFRIRAVNAVGLSRFSAPSNLVTAR